MHCKKFKYLKVLLAIKLHYFQAFLEVFKYLKFYFNRSFFDVFFGEFKRNVFAAALCCLRFFFFLFILFFNDFLLIHLVYKMAVYIYAFIYSIYIYILVKDALSSVFVRVYMPHAKMSNIWIRKPDFFLS